jgi:hypothetical protein
MAAGGNMGGEDDANTIYPLGKECSWYKIFCCIIDPAGAMISCMAHCLCDYFMGHDNVSKMLCCLDAAEAGETVMSKV